MYNFKADGMLRSRPNVIVIYVATRLRLDSFDNSWFWHNWM